MPLSPTLLANQILVIQKQVPPAKEELMNYCAGFIAMIQAGVVNHALVTGVTAPGAPLASGAASAGLITVTPGPWIGKSGDIGPLAIAEHTAVTTYIQTNALVNFPAGTVTGNCTSTPTSPGPLAAGAAFGGQISGLVGSSCASFVAAATGGQLFGPDAEPIYTAMMDYVMQTAKAAYITGTITGTCPPGGGSLVGGLGTGGVIS